MKGQAVVSWGSVLAGLLVALAALVVLVLAGTGVGLLRVDAERTVADVGLRTAAWWVLALLLSLFIGGFVAARLAGVRSRTVGALHGALVWSAAALVGTWLAAGGLADVGAAATGAATQSAAALATRLGIVPATPAESAAPPDGAGEQPTADGSAIRSRVTDTIRSEATALVRARLARSPSTDATAPVASTAGDLAPSSANDPTTDSGAEAAALATVDDLLAPGEPSPGALANARAMLRDRLSLGAAEAERIVEGWRARISEAEARAQAAVARLKDRAREAARTGLHLAGAAAAGFALALVVGLLAALAGALAGRPPQD
ncbi:hypothetical protein [Acuticoccus mangrovi]|uniref:Uncharacterized protein n=1 Tax=Acuticoccus mangrovi TaxID=2796142 RepID=A0A934ITE2_9HYPH|nr:hypothetical protein [Acuticoccus mangrovi]MBJ3777690.1 hypothetical protein [Acuticoccus mangrovi]